MVGGFVAGYMMQAIGRKFTSILSAVPYIIGLTVSSTVESDDVVKATSQGIFCFMVQKLRYHVTRQKT